MSKDDDARLLDDLLGASAFDATDGDEDDLPPLADDIADPEDSWMWPGYIMDRRITNLEAPGSSGKSRFALGIASCLSHGVFPFGLDCEPVKVEPRVTLALAAEDPEEDIAATYRECGGRNGFLRIYNAAKQGGFCFDGEGYARLRRWVMQTGVRCILIDPVIAYVPRDVRSQNDNVAITQFMAGLNGFCAEMNIAALIVRHFGKSTVDKEVHQLAAGGEAWRNSARGQFVMFAHPDNAPGITRVLIVPSRDTMRVQYRPAFEMVIDQGLQRFVAPGSVALEPYAERYPALKRKLGLGAKVVERGDRGPAPRKVQEAADALVKYLTSVGGQKFSTTAIEEVLVLNPGMAKRTVYRAKDLLIETKQIEDVSGVWSLVYEEDDPFA